MGEDLTGREFGYLTVIGLHRKHHKGNSWLCKCKCGNEIVLGTAYLLGNETRRPNKSCGCEKRRYKGVMANHKRLYGIWKGMIDRCYNDERDNFERFGGKGIKMCEEWRNDFIPFLEWSLENGYEDNLLIGRVDIGKQYEPNNCKWSDMYDQIQKRGLMRNNTTGFTGVSYSEKLGYRAYITRFKKRYNLGCYKTLAEAVDARKKAEERLSRDLN